MKKFLNAFMFGAAACAACASDELYDMLEQFESAESLLGQSRFGRTTQSILSQKELAKTADWGGAMLVFKLENTAGLPFWKWRSYVGEYTYAFYVLQDYEKSDNWQKIRLFPEIKNLSEQ